MLQIASFYPVTVAPFKYFLNQKKRIYFPIQPSSDIFIKALKQSANSCRKVAITLAMAVTVVAVPILFLIDSTIHLLRKLKLVNIKTHFDDYHYYFNSDVSTAHLRQLRDFTWQQISQSPVLLAPHDMYSEFFKRTRLLIDLILSSEKLTHVEQKRQFHQQFTEQLRALVSHKQSLQKPHLPEIQEAIAFIDALCEWFYTKPNLLQKMEEFVLQQVPESLHSLTNELGDASKVIKELHSYIDTLMKFNGITETSRLYDPRYLGDVPSQMFTYRSPVTGHKTTMIRTPAVTRDLKKSSKGIVVEVAIVDEFRGFMDSYMKQGKKHLYINLMQRNGSEGIRSSAIEHLESHYPNTLNVVTLTKDFDFYWQNDKYKAISDASVFKKLFIETLFKKNDHFHWSPALPSNWALKCEAILDVIHKNLFQNKAQLAKKERQDFIEITYTFIVDALIEQLKPDSCNISCKSCIDRGAAFLAEQYSKHASQEENSVKRTIAIALAPALLAQNRVMQNARLDRYFTSMQTLHNGLSHV